MQNRKIVRAIDVGYGNNKFILSHIHGDDGRDTPVNSFPSIVVPEARNRSFKSIFGEGDAQSVIIPSGTVNYVVGPAALDATNGTLGRNLQANFSTTEEYLALVRGALYNMAVPKIDMLIVGLPMNTFHAHKDGLRNRLICAHAIPNPRQKLNPHADKATVVEVVDVRVLPQPVGAFYSYTLPRNLYDQMSDETNLILDVGYGTFDWFLAYGVRPQITRCDAYPGGVAAIAMAIADQIDPSLRLSPRVMQHIDEALDERRADFYAKGSRHKIADFKSVASSKIGEQVNAMFASVQSLSDVQNVLLTGGGSKTIPSHAPGGRWCRQTACRRQPAVFQRLRISDVRAAVRKCLRLGPDCDWQARPFFGRDPNLPRIIGRSPLPIYLWRRRAV